MNQECYSRFTEQFQNEKILFLSAHGMVLKRPEEQGSAYATSPDLVNLGSRVVMTAITYGTGLKAVVGAAYESMDKSQLGRMICGSEATRIETLKQVMDPNMWEVLSSPESNQSVQTLVTNNIHFGGTMENMAFDFFLSHPRYEMKEGKREQIAITIEAAGITDFNQKSLLYGRPRKVILKSDEAFNKVDLVTKNTIDNLTQLDSVFNDVIVPYFIPEYAEDGITKLPYNVMLLNYFYDKAKTKLKQKPILGVELLDISLYELLKLPGIPHDAMLCILSCRADEETCAGKPTGELTKRTQEFEQYIKSIDRLLERSLSDYCAQTRCSGIVRGMPGTGFSQDAFCKGKGCLSCVPSSDQRANPATGEVPMVCKGCEDDYTVLVGCRSSNAFDFICFTLTEMQTIYQGFITENHSGQNTIADVPVKLGEGVMCVIDKMTIAALLCVGGHNVGCVYVMKGVHTNLDVFNPDQLQEAYKQFLVYVVHPFIYVAQSMMRDLYDHTLGRVMAEYVTHVTSQFETGPEKFMEIICQRPSVDLHTYENCEQSLLAYIKLTLDSLQKLLYTNFPESPNGLEWEYREALTRWVEGTLTHLPKKRSRVFVDSSGSTSTRLAANRRC